MTKLKPNKFTWPVWFPYPSSWLKAFILALFLGIIMRIISFTGNIGYKMANFANSPELFMIVTILVIILPIFIITFTHHIFHIFIKKLFPKMQSSEMQNVQGYMPTIVSIWEGLYGWLVICLSSLIAAFITIFLSPISDINFYETTKFYRDYENYQETILTILGLTWITTGALIYQVDFLFKRRLLSISSTNISLNQEPQIDHIDHVEVELNNLKGDNGFTQMKESKKSSETSPISSISQQKNKFEEAINLAKKAAQITRIAKSKSEWYQAGIAWQEVIEIMKKVPTSDPNYEAAQQKIIDYQKYVNYAKKAINSQNIN